MEGSPTRNKSLIMKNLIDIYESLLDDEETMMANADKAAIVGVAQNYLSSIFHSENKEEYDKNCEDFAKYFDQYLGEDYKRILSNLRVDKKRFPIVMLHLSYSESWRIIIPYVNKQVMSIYWHSTLNKLMVNVYRTTMSNFVMSRHSEIRKAWIMKNEWVAIHDKMISEWEKWSGRKHM